MHQSDDSIGWSFIDKGAYLRQDFDITRRLIMATGLGALFHALTEVRSRDAKSLCNHFDRVSSSCNEGNCEISFFDAPNPRIL